jgi:hypothetical protein
MTAIAEPLLLAYLRTRYRVLGDEGFVLRIGERSEELAELLRHAGRDCAAFLTAWNPRGELASAEQNRHAQDSLLGELRARGFTCVAGAGEDPDGEWAGEESALVPGLGLGEASLLAARYGQNALVWAGADARPQLILLR